MTLRDLITAIKEKDLTKEQLEAYRDEMSHVYAEMQMEMAELEKEEALFMDATFARAVEESVAQRNARWKGTDKGQRLIVLKRYCLATKELLNSLRSRLYSVY